MFKISFRHIWHTRLYSLINVIGLAVGITCMLLAVLYWKHERSFDEFHNNNPNLYRLNTKFTNREGTVVTSGGTGQVQGPAFKAAVPELNQYVRILGGGLYSDIRTNDKTIKVRGLFVDKHFFDVFTFPMLKGNSQTALQDIAGVVLTESTALKFFNHTDVIGKLITMEADPSFEKLGKPLIITAIVKDPPENSSLQFEALFTFDFMHLSFEDTNWLNGYLGTFIVLRPDADPSAVLSKFNKIYSIYGPPQVKNPDFNIHGYDPKITYDLQPITDIHLNPYLASTGTLESGIAKGSSPLYSQMFMGIACFILLMAAINFINISIANSLKRAKEVGVRKITGGNSIQIIMQFLTESSILCIAAFVLSMLLLNTLLPLFNAVTGEALILSEVFDAKLAAYFTILLATIVVMTGLYPAYIVSRFKPTEVLYNKQRLSGRNLLGRGLVVLQFSLAIFLLIVTIVYYTQMDYIRTKDLGYNPRQVIKTEIYGDRDYKSIVSYLKNELAGESSIKSVSFGNIGYEEDVEINGRRFKGLYKNIDEHFLGLMEIPLKLGRNLSPDFPMDAKEGAMVNEAFVKASGLDDLIGKKVKVNLYYDSSIKTIQGIVRDFHFGSLREPIKPMVMYMKESPDGTFWVKAKPGKQREAIADVQKAYLRAMPGALFQYDFLDELNAKQYTQEQRWYTVINAATTLAFVICCLGLFGLAHLAAGRRIKEIGIRKVLGASAREIAMLLAADFVKLVVIAFGIAAPLSWMIMNDWLQDFAYRTEISWLIFVAAGMIAVSIAVCTISFQAIKASMANPVKALRTE